MGNDVGKAVGLMVSPTYVGNEVTGTWVGTEDGTIVGEVDGLDVG